MKVVADFWGSSASTINIGIRPDAYPYPKIEIFLRNNLTDNELVIHTNVATLRALGQAIIDKIVQYDKETK